LAERDVPLAAELCRRLDGVPLAIELAAGRVEQFGLAGLLARLDDRFMLLKEGLRTAHPRHRTLRATLDWSYDILSEQEQLVLRRVAPFKGEFTFESAAAMVGEPNLGGRDVMECLANLAAKSLVAVNVSGEVATYRLQDVNRAYALDKLSESDDSRWIFRRHCEHCRSLLEHVAADRKLGGTPEQFSIYHRITGDVRAALDWAFSPAGDAALGISLTNAAVPLWFRLSLIDECRTRLERAINALSEEQRQNSREAMQLYAALGSALMNTNSVGPDMTMIWTTVLRIAERLDDFDYRLRAHWGLWVDCCNQGRYADALEIAKGAWSVAAGSSDPVDLAVSNRWIAVSLHYIGEQSAARQYFERTLSYEALDVGKSDSMRFQYNQGVAARCYLGQIALQQGFPDRAMSIVDRNVQQAISLNHELTLCFALTEGGCPIALQVGDLETADRFTAMLLDLTERRALTGWHAMGHVFRAMLLARRGDIDAAAAVFRGAVDDVRRARLAPRFTSILGYYAEVLGHAGDIAGAHTIIDEALQRSDSNEERWCIAELLRIKGDIVRRQDHATAIDEAEDYLLRSLDWARRHDSLLWELRAAVSFAELRRGQGRLVEARDLLMPVYQRFTEGFGSADLRAAENLLKVLS
jgi:predicted ATPase